MQVELEVKILDINPEAIRKRLRELGAVHKGDSSQKRYVYDVKPAQPGAWIRLRDNGQKTTLTIKEITNDDIDGTREIEIETDDFNTTNQLLEYLGFKARAYQENRRSSYELDGAEVELDEWPKIPPYLEIESKSKGQIDEVLKKLGYSRKDTTSINTEKVYSQYGLDIHSYKELKF